MRAFIIASIVFGMGCGGGTEGELTKYKEKMCACDNKECAEKVFEEYNAWAKGARDEAKKMSKDDRKKLEDIDHELKACRRKFRDEDKKNATDPAGSAAAPAGSAATP